VVNGHPRVTDETRTSVLSAIEALNFRPSFWGRALALRRTKTIGVIVSDIRNPFFPEIVHAVEAESREHGYLPILCDVEGPASDQFAERLMDQGIDGLLAASAAGGDFSRFRSAGLPVVLLNHRDPAFTHSYVIPDYRAGAALATRHLVELGHQRIAHIRGPLEVSASVARERGYLDALEAAGLDYARVAPVPDFSPESGREAVVKLMRSAQPPTGIFVVNDYCALGVLHGLSDVGARVPGDVAVVGYDDIWPAHLPSIALTTVSSGMHTMGTIGTRMLLRMISEGVTWAEPMTLEPQLVIRATSAPATEAGP
jgi:LacI family transcriptional regulator